MGTPSRSRTSSTPDAQMAVLKRGAVDVLSEGELRTKLAKGTPLTIKAGFDPSAPDLHLGHAVLLNKLRQFQDLGHTVVFLIGDATGLVGDPSGQTQTRPVLTRKQVQENARTYVNQVARILDTKQHFSLRYNSEWFYPKRGQGFDFAQLIELTQRYTVARILERDDFQKRLRVGQDISMLELYYPLMQGYDSVQIQSDVELGGTDQKFNLLVGRDLQRRYHQEPQVVMTMPLLVGLDGVQKMSKSLGNHIGITESPKEMFGKLMSIPDALMESYATLLTDLEWSALSTAHPKAAKVTIGKAIVTQYHSAAEAERQAEAFDRIFTHKQAPDEMPEVRMQGPTSAATTLKDLYKQPQVKAAMVTHLNITSANQLQRLIQQKGLKVDGQPIASIEAAWFQPDRTYTLQSGPRRFLRLTLQHIGV